MKRTQILLILFPIAISLSLATRHGEWNGGSSAPSESHPVHRSPSRNHKRMIEEAEVETSAPNTVGTTLARQEAPLSLTPQWLKTSNPIEPSQPGSMLRSGGQLVEVKAYHRMPRANGVALTIEVSDLATLSATSPDQSSGIHSSTNFTSGKSAAAIDLAAKHSGFTHEEELFRTKWGWVAFAEAQKAASEAP